MNRLDEYQAVIAARWGNRLVWYRVDGLPRDAAEELLRQFHRPHLFRRDKGLDLPEEGGGETFVPWKLVEQLRVQPQVEAIA